MLDLFLGGAFKKSDSKKFIKRVHQLAKVTDELNSKKKELNDIEYNLLLENKDTVYISLDQFLKFMDKGKVLEMKDIISSFTHVDDLKSTGKSSVEVFLIPEEDGHISICADVKNCEKHNLYKGDPVRISTIKRV